MNRAAIIVVLAWLTAAIVAWWLPDAPVALDAALQPPSSDFLLGTDPLGRPLTSLLLGGAQTAALIGLTSVVLAGAFGIAVGIAAGLRGGIVDTIVVRAIDVLLAFPGILLAIALTAALGPSVTNIVIALTVLGWTGFARLARGQALQLKQEAFVDAANCIGVPSSRIALVHIFPNLLGPIMVQATFAIAGTIIAESSLSFLGLGDPSQPSWGALLADGVRFLRDAPHLSIFPGLAISAVVLSLNIAGDGLADRSGGAASR